MINRGTQQFLSFQLRPFSPQNNVPPKGGIDSLNAPRRVRPNYVCNKIGSLICSNQATFHCHRDEKAHGIRHSPNVVICCFLPPHLLVKVHLFLPSKVSREKKVEVSSSMLVNFPSVFLPAHRHVSYIIHAWAFTEGRGSRVR